MQSSRPVTRIWQKKQVLGQGGGGEVWLVHAAGDPTQQAVLKLAQQEQEQALYVEWLALHDVASPLLPEPLAWLPATANERAGLLMAMRPGQPLSDVLPTANLQQIEEIVRQLLHGLAALHAAGLLHGDLHPGNILVDLRGDKVEVSLLDLGLAQAVAAPVRGPGQPACAAPDRLRAGAGDVRDDLFSLAMAIWLALGLPPPYENYPAVLPHESQQPSLPDWLDQAKRPLLQLLATWLAPSRKNRPTDAELALRSWQQLCGTLGADTAILADEFDQLAARRWRWQNWSGTGDWPAAERRVWLVGPHGSGRTGALVALAARGARLDQPTILLQGTDPQAFVSEASRLWPDVAWAAFAAPPLAALGDARGAAVARWADFLLQVGQALTPQGCLLVDDFAMLPLAAQRAVVEVELPCASVVAAAEQPPSANGVVWNLPQVQAIEVLEGLRRVAHGRRWDADIGKRIAAATGAVRAEILPLAAALLRRNALLVLPDRVEWTDEISADLCAQIAAQRQSLQLPNARWHAALAQAAIAGRTRSVLGADADIRQWLRTVIDGHWVPNSDTLRKRLMAELPRPLLAQTARALADTTSDRFLATEWRAFAAHLLNEDLQADAESAPALDELLREGDAERALDLLDKFSQPLAGSMLALQLRALTQLGRVSLAEQRLAAADAATREIPQVLLAASELAFHRGDYPQCREVAQRAIDSGDRVCSLQARLWQAFAATWQGDRAAARVLIGDGQRLAAGQNAPEQAAFAYLAALADYYEGRLDAAQTAAENLYAAHRGALQAAAAGALGLIAHRRGQLPVARQWYDQSRALAEKSGDRSRALNMVMNAAVLDHEIGDLGRALQGYDWVVAAAQRLDNAGALSRALNNRANLLALLGLDDPARLDLNAALAALDSAQNGYLLGNVHCIFAELDRRVANFVSADAHLQIAQQALGQAGAKNELLEIRLEHALTHLDRDQFVEATAVANDVLTAAQKLPSDELQARAILVQWQIARRQNADAPPAWLQHWQLQLKTALALAPRTKPLLCAQLTTENAVLLARQGQLGAAQDLARQQQISLDQIAATLPTERRLAFVHAAVHAAMRAKLDLLAHLGQGQALPEVPTHAAGALQAVLTINRRLGGEYDLAQLLEIVMDSAVILTGAERGFLLLDPEDESDLQRRTANLRVAVARNLDRENLRKAAHKLSHSIALRVFQSGERVLATDAQNDDRFAAQASVHTASLRSILCVPLSCQGRTIGVVYVDNRFTSGAFSAQHALVLEALADQAAIAIQTARVIANQRKTAEQLVRSQSEIAQLNEQLQQQLDATANELQDAKRDLTVQRLEQQRRGDFGQIKGESPLLHRLFALMERVRDHDFPVVIHGESGTGKELVARAIHFTGRRKAGPFVAINCGALPSNLLESELFGHVRGAFTGALAERRGLFETANGGTLLLDEIGEMPPEMQVRLLRVLQLGEIQRVGDSIVRKVDVRVVAATHRDLQGMVTQGLFREDLLYRLRVVDLEVPPLRQRPEDLPPLIEHFLTENRKIGLGKVDRVSPAALRKLRQFGWPGNVRQLETVLKSACLFAQGSVLEPIDFEQILRERAGGMPQQSASAGAQSWWDTATFAEIETRLLQARVTSFGGNKRKAAESLGIDRSTIYNRLR